MKTVYLYDPDTMVYKEPCIAHPSPLEPGKYLMPTHATELNPPMLDDKFKAVFNGDKWIITPDHRGETWFKDDGTPVEIKVLGTPTGLNQDLPAKIVLANIKAAKQASLMEGYNAEINAPILFVGNTYQADTNSVNELSQVLSIGAVPNNFYWLNIDNKEVPMDFATLQELGVHIRTRKQAAFTKLQSLKQQLKATDSVTEIGNLVW